VACPISPTLSIAECASGACHGQPEPARPAANPSAGSNGVDRGASPSATSDATWRACGQGRPARRWDPQPPAPPASDDPWCGRRSCRHGVRSVVALRVRRAGDVSSVERVLLFSAVAPQHRVDEPLGLRWSSLDVHLGTSCTQVVNQ